MRSRVTWNVRPTSSSVRGCSPFSPHTELEHPPLPVGQRPQNLDQRLLAEDVLGDLRAGRQLVGDEVPELGLLVVAHRLLERDRGLRAAPDLIDLVDRQVELVGDLL